MTGEKMTLEELTRWLEDNGVPYEIDEAGRLAVKDALLLDFTVWVRTRKYTGLPDELVCAKGDLWLEETSITSLGNLTSVGGVLNLWGIPIASLDGLPQVGGDLLLDQSQPRLLTGEVLQKVAGEICCWRESEKDWIELSPSEQEAVIAENEVRESPLLQ